MQNQAWQGRSVLRGKGTLQLLQGTLAGWAKKQSTESADGLWWRCGPRQVEPAIGVAAGVGSATDSGAGDGAGSETVWDVRVCVCCQQWRNGVCNFMQLFPFVYDDFLFFVRVLLLSHSVCVSPSPFPFGCLSLGQTKRANFKLAERSFLLSPPAFLSTFLSQSHE